MKGRWCFNFLIIFFYLFTVLDGVHRISPKKITSHAARKQGDQRTEDEERELVAAAMNERHWKSTQ